MGLHPGRGESHPNIFSTTQHLCMLLFLQALSFSHSCVICLCVKQLVEVAHPEQVLPQCDTEIHFRSACLPLGDLWLHLTGSVNISLFALIVPYLLYGTLSCLSAVHCMLDVNTTFCFLKETCVTLSSVMEISMGQKKHRVCCRV